jgi:hypothetical protein
MGTAQGVKKPAAGKGGRRRGHGSSGAAPSPSEAQLRELLDAALTEIDRDARSGSLLHAKGMRMRFRFTDLDLTLTVVPGDGAAHHLRWRFDDAPDWEPKLELAMSSAVANAYLQGGESLAIALARGRMTASGDTRCALFYVPALRLLVDVYRREIRRRYPALALD